VAARPVTFAFLLLFASAVCVAAAGAEPPQLSLLAVGDTGAPPDDPEGTRTQLAVAAAMAASDRARPVHALVLLGDNFYPAGLLRGELVARLRANLVRPYCHFLQLAGPGAPDVAGACETPAAERHPVPLFATLGNHDHLSAESPALQRTAPRRFLADWHMPLGAASVYELGGGVSLVVLDSDPVFEGADVEPLIEALRASRGPWRILAAHHPIANRDRGSELERHARYRRVVLAAVAVAGVPVHLVLAAHEHNLQLLALDPPAPALHAIAGGGSNARSLHGPDPRPSTGSRVFRSAS
jgi:3',5'-cyclic AMP phosphodiesterase CpdA